MAYKAISGNNYTGTGNLIASGPCIVRIISLYNSGPDPMDFEYKVGADYASSKTIKKMTALAAGFGSITGHEDCGLALNAGQKLFLDVIVGTGPAAAAVFGLAP
jgi:hypothetical protein